MYKPRFQYDAQAATSGGATSTIVLKKDERVAIVDKDNNPLTNLYVGGGWKAGEGFDLDLIAICLNADGKLVSNDLHTAVGYYGNKTLPGIQLSADNRTGEGEGDDEFIKLDLNAIPANVAAVICGINIYNPQGKTFGGVNNAFMRYCDAATVDPRTQAGTIKRYDLTEDYSTHNCIIACRIYRHESGWKIQAIGEGRNASIQQLADSYK